MEQEGSNFTKQPTQFSDQQIDASSQRQVSFPFKKYVAIFLALFIVCLLGVTSFTLYANNQHTNKNQVAPPLAVQQITQSNNTQSELSSITGSPKTTSTLPLGDNKYTTSGPAKGYIYLCNLGQGQGGAQEIGNWIHGNTWNLSEKPNVSGTVSWPNASFSNIVSGSNRIITGNGLPLHTITGIFPIQSTDAAYQYDRNPNHIIAHSFTLSLPTNPVFSSTPSCMGGEVGIMLNGVPLFNGFDAEHRDAAAHEVQDSCDGHPQESGEYHYHSLSRCITDIHETTVIGYALDGFPITGPVLPNGNYLTTNDLDECHGITSEIVLDGKKTTTYHYVMTEDFPYSASCFRGKPVSMQVMSSQQSINIQGGQTGVQKGQKPQPPQEAFTICNGKQTGTSCSFTAPRGTVTGTCQSSQTQTSMVCVPSNTEENQGRPLSPQQ